jgi:hypothetical protein
MPEELNTDAAFKRWTDSRAHSPERIRGACLTQPLPITTIHHSARKSARAGPALVSIEPPPIFTFAAPFRDSTAPRLPAFAATFTGQLARLALDSPNNHEREKTRTTPARYTRQPTARNNNLRAGLKYPPSTPAPVLLKSPVSLDQ